MKASGGGEKKKERELRNWTKSELRKKKVLAAEKKELAAEKYHDSC